MPDFDFATISDDALKQACSRSLYTVDGLWFLAVEEKFGFDAAFELNQVVWSRGGYIHGKRLLKNLDTEGKKPMKVLFELILADPLMLVHQPEIETLEDDRAVMRLIQCPIQVARIRDGRGVYDGKPGCGLLFQAYAGLVDPRIEARCVACAPNPENPEYWCEWEFVLKDEEDGGSEQSS